MNEPEIGSVDSWVCIPIVTVASIGSARMLAVVYEGPLISFLS